MADILPPAPIDAPFASYNWTDWYKKVRDAINNGGNVTHNTLNGLQGGGGGDYFHLSGAERTSLASLIANDWQYTKVAVDVTTSSTTPTTVLSFTPQANKTYVVECFLLVQSSATTVGMKPGVTWPSGLIDGAAYIQGTNSSTSTVIANVNYSASGSAAGTDYPAANTSYPALLSATFTTGPSVSGDFSVTIAAEI